jgi:ankyrin repeat protein
MIELGADITIRNGAHLTPLMLCCKEGIAELAEVLLGNDANINDTNILGDTPLKLAQRFGHEELALLLINKYRALIQNRPSSSVGKK